MAGLAMLGTVYVTAMRAGYAQMAVRAELYRVTTASGFPGAGPPRADVAVPRLPTSLVGELSIPRLNLSTAVLEGDNADTLRLAVGHLPDTPLPWQDGNSAYAGHRDTFFRALRSVQEGDLIQLTTPRGTYDYRVRHLLVVKPTDVWVLDSALASLTLITCYPFTYVGSAPERFIVQADRADAAPLVPARTR